MSEASAALIKKIWEAFPPLEPLSPLLRSQWSQLSSEDLKAVLGEVLTELLEGPDRTNASRVIRMLDVPVFRTEESRAALAEALGANGVFQTKRANDHLRAWKAQTFDTFTPAQASAIEHWLRAVQDWPELTFMHDTVQSALSYWAKQARE